MLDHEVENTFKLLSAELEFGVTGWHEAGIYHSHTTTLHSTPSGAL